MEILTIFYILALNCIAIDAYDRVSREAKCTKFKKRLFPHVNIIGKQRLDVTFQCKDNLVSVGPKSAQCKSDRTWNNQPPFCRDIKCEDLDPSKVNNLDWELVDGATLKFSCRESYILVGDTLAYCNDTKWNAKLPICAESSPQTSPTKTVNSTSVMPTTVASSTKSESSSKVTMERQTSQKTPRPPTHTTMWKTSKVQSFTNMKTNKRTTKKTTEKVNTSMSDGKSQHTEDDTLEPLIIGFCAGIVASVNIIVVLAFVCLRRRKSYTSQPEDELLPISDLKPIMNMEPIMSLKTVMNPASLQSLNNGQFNQVKEQESESGVMV